MTGLPTRQVTELVAAVHTQVGEWRKPTGRRRALGLYRAVVLTLFLLRHNVAEDVAGELFGCSQPTVSRTFRRLYPLLNQANAELVTAVAAQAQRSAVLVDGFVVPTGNRRGRPELYSGKRHLCGLNVQAMSDTAGRLVDVGDPQPGSRHDAPAFVDSGLAARWAAHLGEGGAGMLADKGYQGTGPATPYRKPPGRELTEVRKTCNTAINRIRAAVERAISHLTNWKILDTGYRGRLTEFPDVLRTVTALEIYRVWDRSFE